MFGFPGKNPDTNPYGSLRISDDLELPREVAQEVTLITGTRGSGKSYSGGVFMEELNKNGLTFICFDTLGAHRKINLPGVEVINVPPNSNINAKSLVNATVMNNRSLILNMVDMSEPQQQALVASFANEIMLARPSRYNKTVTVIVEEAQTFAPAGNAKSIYESILPLDSLTKKGRAFGIGVVYITQRPQDFSMRLRSQTSTFIIHGLKNPNELRVVRDHVRVASRKESDEVVHKVHNFNPGEALVISPHIPTNDGMAIVKIRQRETQHSGTNVLGDSPIFDTGPAQKGFGTVNPLMSSSMPGSTPMVFGGKDDIREILVPSRPKKRVKVYEYASMAAAIAIIAGVAYTVFRGYRRNINEAYDSMEKGFSKYAAQMKEVMDEKGGKSQETKEVGPSDGLSDSDVRGMTFNDGEFFTTRTKADSLMTSITSDFNSSGPFKQYDPR